MATYICLFLQNIFPGLRHLIFIILLFSVFSVHAQILKGIVVDGADSKPLSPVTVINLSTQQSTYTDEHGNYMIEAKNGDQIAFSYVGYHTVQKATPPAIGVAEMRVEMLQQNFELKEYVLHDYTPYQKDSIAMRETYNKELNTSAIKPKVGMNNGLEVDGLIGSAVQKISRGYKKNKKFKEEFIKQEQDLFIDTRYTPTLVNSLTGFTGDTLAFFINTYPMDYGFARTASDLEIKMWIRYNYKEYIREGKDTLSAPVLQAKQEDDEE